MDHTATEQPALVAALLDWYAARARSLPWRETADPYAIWVSEIMLQQTKVETVIPYYRRFLERFPSVAALAAAPLEAVLKVWENLGYYSRARLLHRAAGLVARDFSGRIPDCWERLIGLPGIGHYTAGAILSIAFGRAVPAIDGNVRRVISRLFALEHSIDETPGQATIEGIVRPLVPAADPGRFNQALMELGALICLPKGPACPNCPVRSHCRALALGMTALLPLRRKRKAVPHKTAVAALIRDPSGRILIHQRPEDGLLGSLWKFPGDLLEIGETVVEGLRRTVRAELGIEITVGEALASAEHAYSHFRVTLVAHEAAIAAGPPATGADRHWRWIEPRELDALPFSKADRMIARQIFPGPLPAA